MNINLHTWFANRECDYLPKHFIATKSPVTDERHLWILEKCQGRFYVGQKEDDDILGFLKDYIVYFEDPQEAILYELTWS